MDPYRAPQEQQRPPKDPMRVILWVVGLVALGIALIAGVAAGAWWDANKVGLSPPLISTPRGWLMLYHGVRQTASGSIYRMGAALFDLERPDVLIARGDDWLFGPEAPYECAGDVANVVFACGYTLGDDGDTLRLYYGAADTCIATATASVREILATLVSAS